MVATRVERAEKLFAERGRQGEFSPKAEKGLFSGFFWTPRHADAFMGMGFVVGYAYEWFALELLEGFYEASHRPIGDDTFESTTRFQIELDAEIQLRFGEYVRVYFGPGVQLNLDDKEIIEDASSVPTKREADDNEVRPAGTIGFSASVFFARVGISEQPRVDMGVVIGR
jgi:hypothetical protein